PLAPVTDLTFYDSTRTLIAGTYGRSMYSLDLSELAVSVHPTQNFASDLNVYPVPFNDFFYVDFSSATDIKGSIEILDVNGSIVSSSEKMFSKGKNHFQCVAVNSNKEKLSCGIYYLRVTIDNQLLIRK